MPADPLDEYFQDPEFRKLSGVDKISVLSRVDPDFAQLPVKDQAEVVQTYLNTPKSPEFGEDPAARARYKQAYGKEPPPGWPHAGFGTGLEELAAGTMPGTAAALAAAPIRTGVGIAGGAATDWGLRKLGLPAPIPELGGTAAGMLIGGPTARDMLRRGARGFIHELLPEVFGGKPPVPTPEPWVATEPYGPHPLPPMTVKPVGEQPFSLTPPEGGYYNWTHPTQGELNLGTPPTKTELDYMNMRARQGGAAPSPTPTQKTTVNIPSIEQIGRGFNPLGQSALTPPVQQELPLSPGPTVTPSSTGAPLRIGKWRALQMARDTGRPLSEIEQHLSNQGMFVDWDVQ